MKFELKTSGWAYTTKQASKLEKLGFEFEPFVDTYGIFGGANLHIKPKDLSIEINTLEELIKLIGNYGSVIVDLGSIEIYDDYRE